MVFILVAMQIPTTSVNVEESSTVWDGLVASSYGGGSGSQEDPFLIANGGQLVLMAQEVISGLAGAAYLITTLWQ